jgi:hypothetical protein
MTKFLQFSFWAAIGAVGATLGCTLYLISAIRRIELFPASTGAFVIPGALVLVTVGCIAWARARKKGHPAVETITIDEPFDLSAVR